MTKIKRLLDSFSPEHYDVSFVLNPEKLTFSGSVTISGSLTETANSITLHSNGLNISSATIDGKKVTSGEQSKHHEISFTSESKLATGEHRIEIEFKAGITPDMVGLYASNFEHEETTKQIIATQFEANHAREAFPCIDEPSAKATFQLTLTSPAENQNLSNTPVENVKNEATQTTTVFEKTPRMSTYLLAFVTGEMHSVERVAANGVVVKCWSSLAQPQNTLDFSADEAVKILDFFEDYFGIPYPLKKCDLVALPDFDAGAMENWGLITFREIALLADPDNRSISSEQYVSMVVAHEISHMWFGNLVTMAWWDDLWLNESFASLMEHVALDAIHPDWMQWEHYAATDIIFTTSRDIHRDIQPISIELDDPDLIETLFDPGIVYTKGGRLLKMLREYLGDDDFRAGLKEYFKKHQYQNATRQDLWDALESASGKNVDSLMSAWLDQPGMPLLTVEQTDKTIKLSQQRFIVDGSTDNSVWPIPLLSDRAMDLEILDEPSAVAHSNEDGYLVMNSSASGQYFTNYANQEHREHVKSMVVDRSLDSWARINHLNDLILISRAKTVPLTEALDVVSAMESEPRYSVWSQISRVISTAQQLTEGNEQARANLNKLRIKLTSKNYTKFGVHDSPGDDPNTVQMRNLTFAMMLGAENESALRAANDIFAKSDNPEKLPSEARSVILGALIKSGNDKLANQLLELYPKTNAEMQLDIVSSLSSTKNPKFAEEILKAALGENGFVRPQDVMRWLAIFLRNHHIREVTWSYLVQNWAWFEKTLMNSKSFDFLPTYCAAVVSTPEMAGKYRKLFEPLESNKYLARNVKIGLADIAARVDWRKQEEKGIIDWLENQS